ncbi:hypothetical protein BJ742DRAFT_278823 [Cladochytrium replicatum]|nr:hypothetical protein BJ742DRAFT_278823 [Cladochytrium replicatum]
MSPLDNARRCPRHTTVPARDPATPRRHSGQQRRDKGATVTVTALARAPTHSRRVSGFPQEKDLLKLRDRPLWIKVLRLQMQARTYLLTSPKMSVSKVMSAAVARASGQFSNNLVFKSKCVAACTSITKKRGSSPATGQAVCGQPSEDKLCPVSPRSMSSFATWRMDREIKQSANGCNVTSSQIQPWGPTKFADEAPIPLPPRADCYRSVYHYFSV